MCQMPFHLKLTSGNMPRACYEANFAVDQYSFRSKEVFSHLQVPIPTEESWPKKMHNIFKNNEKKWQFLLLCEHTELLYFAEFELLQIFKAFKVWNFFSYYTWKKTNIYILLINHETKTLISRRGWILRYSKDQCRIKMIRCCRNWYKESDIFTYQKFVSNDSIV